MDYTATIIYGVVQGLSEFLPVSSSGHLALLPLVMQINDPGVLFDLGMHVGTAFSVIVYFRRDIGLLVMELFNWLTRREAAGRERPYLKNMLTATMATVILAVPLKHFAEQHGRSPALIAFNLAFFGVLMFLADWFGGKAKKTVSSMTEEFKPLQALSVGVAQALALFPGVSRSGITLTAGRALGLKREDATEFSFLLSIPLILGGFIMELPKLFHGQQSFNLMDCLLGAIISFLIGMGAIHLLLKLVRRFGLVYFAIYRLLLAVLVYGHLIN